MPASCTDIRAALATCLQNSDCVLVHRNTPSDCLRYPLSETLPTQCQQLKHGYGECKRGLIDMRKRFRGNKPISTSTELEAGGGREGDRVDGTGMLYAGKGSYEGVGPKGTEGKKLEDDDDWEKFVRNDGVIDVRRKK